MGVTLACPGASERSGCKIGASERRGGNNGRWKVEGVGKKERNVEIEVEENGRKEE